MGIRRIIVTLSVIAAGFAISTPMAHAVTCNVPSTAYPTINSATADPSCTTIKLGKGPFYENETVPNPGTTIVGKGGECGEKPQTIIDGSPGGVDATTTHVQASDVTIKGVVMRHGSAGIDADGDRLKAIDLCILGARGGDDAIGVRIDGDDGLVKASEIHSLDGAAVRVAALSSGATVTKNIFRNIGHDCVKAFGGVVSITSNRMAGCDDTAIRTENKADVTIEDNTIRNVDNGISHSGQEDGTASGNKITNIDNQGIRMNASGDKLIRSNEISSRNRCIEAGNFDGTLEIRSNHCVESGGISANANDPVIRDNRVGLAWDSHGFRITCHTTCTGAQIVGNTVGGNNRDRNGFELDADGPGGLFRDNVSVESGNAGFRFNDVDGWTIDGNQAIRSGQREGGNERVGFRFSGSESNTVTNNVATESRDDGFHIRDFSHGNTFTNNKATANAKDGFHAEGGDGNTLDGNKAKDNHAEGIENDGLLTTITDNVAKGNRWDCNFFDGTESPPPTGNTCADGLDPDTLPPQGQVD